MNWILENTGPATVIVIVAYIIFLGVVIVILASSKTPEVEDLQGAPETLGDFPPLTWQDLIEFKEKLEEQEKKEKRWMN